MHQTTAPQPATCPFAESARFLRTGGVAEAEILRVEEHVAQCAVCSELTDALDESSDAMLRALSTLPISPDDEPEFQRLHASLLSATLAETADGGIGPRLADPPIGPLPQLLGNYELQECIGRGAWGAIFQARHVTLDQTFAVKVLDSSRWRSPAYLERFVQEARAAGQLNHPNIVRATDAGEHRGLHYLVMDYIHGVDAARLLRQTGPLAIADACEIVRQAAAALDFAHRRGWIHRDVKPSNLMITPHGLVKLLDLGIAGRREEGSDGTPVAHAPLGTADYMAPEQWTNFAAVDARADVYSLGCTLFKLISGRAAYEGGNGLPGSASSDAPPPSLATYRREVRRGLDTFVRRMLARRPEDRVATAADVAETLAAWSRRADLPKLVGEICGRRSGDEPDELDRTSVATLPARRRVSRRAVLVAGGAATIATAAAAPWLWLTRHPQLRLGQWRPLAPAAPPILLAVESPEQFRVQIEADGRVAVESKDLVLVDLGRAVAGLFTFRVLLRQDAGPSGAGVFFQYRLTNERPVCEFQSIELICEEGAAASTRGQLVWSNSSASIEGGKLTVHRDAWAEIAVELAPGGRPQDLRVVLGRSGFPDVQFNGNALERAAWTLSTEGHRQASLPPDRVRRQYLGGLGLLNAGGGTTFLNPQLAYL